MPTYKRIFFVRLLINFLRVSQKQNNDKKPIIRDSELVCDMEKNLGRSYVLCISSSKKSAATSNTLLHFVIFFFK